MTNKLIALSTILILACTSEQVDLAQRKQEVLDTEKRFNDHARDQGLKSAFVEFAAPEAALNRGGRVINGPEAIGTYFDGFDYRSVSLTWEPDFVDVAKSGELAYTYGKFLFTSTDSLGIEKSTEGIFHTVWKRQEDGSWKYVWD